MTSYAQGGTIKRVLPVGERGPEVFIPKGEAEAMPRFRQFTVPCTPRLAPDGVPDMICDQCGKRWNPQERGPDCKLCEEAWRMIEAKRA